MLNGEDARTLDDGQLRAIVEELCKSTYRQRVEQWGLRPERAQVIVPACFILQACLEDLSWDRIQLPQGGLVDGILDYLANALPGGGGQPLQISTFY